MSKTAYVTTQNARQLVNFDVENSSLSELQQVTIAKSFWPKTKKFQQKHEHKVVEALANAYATQSVREAFEKSIRRLRKDEEPHSHASAAPEFHRSEARLVVLNSATQVQQSRKLRKSRRA
eukprot:6174906-Pleurochrysis_carterae.AAC.1